MRLSNTDPPSSRALGPLKVATRPVQIKSSAAHGWDETLMFDVNGPPTGECRHEHEHVSLQIWWQPVGMRSLKGGPWRSVEPGARLWVPGEEQHFEWRRSARVNIVFITPERVERILEQPYSRSNFDAWRTLEFRSAFVSHIVAAMSEDIAWDCPAGALVGDSLTTALVAHLATGPRHVRAAQRFPGPSPKSFERALQYIEANLALPLRVTDLASAAGCSPRQLSRAFREHKGKLPHDYVIEKRVERASVLIDAGQLSLAQVAMAVGFADQSQMTKMFRKLLGTTPGRCRNGRTPDGERARLLSAFGARHPGRGGVRRSRESEAGPAKDADDQDTDRQC
jgi:AraC-like DNA-binding protein